MGHKVLLTTFLLYKLALVGRISWHALHKKLFSALGIGSFHKAPHISFCSTRPKLSACICNSLIFAVWYALRTVNKPFFVPFQIKTYSRFGLMGIDRIALSSSKKNRFSIKPLFHSCRSLSMSSTTLASWSNTRGRDWIANVVKRGTIYHPKSLPSPHSQFSNTSPP